MPKRLTRCVYCDDYIDPAYGCDAPADHVGAAGTRASPKAPGDYDNVCDVCCYELGRKGSPFGEAPDDLDSAEHHQE